MFCLSIATGAASSRSTAALLASESSRMVSTDPSYCPEIHGMRPVRNANTDVPKIGRHSSPKTARSRGLSNATDDWSGSLMRIAATMRIATMAEATIATSGTKNVAAYTTSAAVWLPSTNRYALRSGSAAQSLPHETLMSASPTPSMVPAKTSSIKEANDSSENVVAVPRPGMARMPAMNKTAPTRPNCRCFEALTNEKKKQPKYPKPLLSRLVVMTATAISCDAPSSPGNRMVPWKQMSSANRKSEKPINLNPVMRSRHLSYSLRQPRALIVNGHRIDGRFSGYGTSPCLPTGTDLGQCAESCGLR